MCTTNIYTYVYPDGRRETSSAPVLCAHSRYGKPCSSNIIFQHPLERVASGPEAPGQEPLYSLQCPFHDTTSAPMAHRDHERIPRRDRRNSEGAVADETTTPLILESRLQRRESTAAPTKGEASGYEGDDEERERIREQVHEQVREQVRGGSNKPYKRTRNSRSQAVFFDGADINNVDGNGNKGGEADVEVSRDYVVVERRAEEPKEQETATTHHTDPLGHGEDNDGQSDSDSSAIRLCSPCSHTPRA